MMTAKSNREEFGPDFQNAHGWRPSSPGDTALGTVVEVDAGWSEWMNDRRGGTYAIITVQEDDGTLLQVHCFGAVLKRRIMSLRPQLGERIKFIYHGKKVRDDNTTVSLYTVRVAGRTRTDVYDRLAASARDGSSVRGDLGANQAAPDSPSTQMRLAEPRSVEESADPPF